MNRKDEAAGQDITPLTRGFTAAVWREDDIFVAQCLELDVASQGATPEVAIQMLREAVELYLEEPRPTQLPAIMHFEAEVPGAS